MRILVCGSRDFNDISLLRSTLDTYDIHEIIEGEAQGADLLSRKYGEQRNIKVSAFPADWNTGKSAGYVRNQKMIDAKPDLVVAFWDGQSRGTKHTIDLAEKAGIPVKVIKCDI